MWMARREFLVLTAAAGLAACARSGGEFRAPDELWHGDQAFADGERQMVASDEATWNQMWLLTNEGTAPRALGQGEVAVAIFLGPRPTAGYGVDLTGRAEDDRRFAVRWRAVSPTAESMVAAVLTSPWAIGIFDAGGRTLSLQAAY